MLFNNSTCLNIIIGQSKPETEFYFKINVFILNKCTYIQCKLNSMSHENCQYSCHQLKVCQEFKKKKN